MYALFYLVSLAKYLRRQTTANANDRIKFRTVENDFRDIAKTFISLRIFSAIEEKSIRDGCPLRGLIRARCYRPRSLITLLIL